MDNSVVSFLAKFRPHCCLTATSATFIGVLCASQVLQMKIPVFTTLCALLFAFLFYGFLGIALENSMQNSESPSFPSRKQRYIPVIALIVLVVLSYLLSPWTLSVLFCCCVLNLLSIHLMRYRFVCSIVYGCANVAFFLYGAATVCDVTLYTRMISLRPFLMTSAFFLYFNFLFKYFNSIGMHNSIAEPRSADELCFKTGRKLRHETSQDGTDERTYYIGCVLLLFVVVFDFVFLMRGIHNVTESTWGFFGLFLTAYLPYLVKRREYDAARRVNCVFFLLHSLLLTTGFGFLTWAVLNILAVACVELVFHFIYPEKD